MPARQQVVRVSLGACAQGPAEAAQAAARRNYCEVFAVDMAFLGSEGLITDRHGWCTVACASAADSPEPVRLPCRNRALLVLACSKPPMGVDGSAVEACLKVQGPATHSFAHLGFADAKKTSYQTFLSWEVRLYKHTCVGLRAVQIQHCCLGRRTPAVGQQDGSILLLASQSQCRPSEACICLQRDYLGNVSVALDCPLQDVTGSQLALPSVPLQFSVVPNVAVRSSAFRVGSEENAIPVPAPALAL